MKAKAYAIPSRTPGGKKLTTWKFNLPDATRAEFEVRLHEERNGNVRFEVASDHTVMAGITLAGTDIVGLKEDLEAAVSERITAHFGADWRDAQVVKIDYSDRTTPDNGSDYSGRRTVRFDFEIQPALQNISRRVGHHGETQVRLGESVRTVLQRAHDQDFSAFRVKGSPRA